MDIMNIMQSTNTWIAKRLGTNDEIDCVGVDNLQHVCLPWENVCRCGIKVKRKKLLKNDYRLLSCYECTY